MLRLVPCNPRESNSGLVNLNVCVVSSSLDLVKDLSFVLLEWNGYGCALTASKAPISVDQVHVHDWVMHVLNVEWSSSACVTPISAKTSTNATHVLLNFVGVESLKPWDDFSLAGPIYLPNTCYSKWPYGVKTDTVERMCETLLIGSVLCEGSMTAVRYLDYLLVFRVESITWASETAGGDQAALNRRAIVGSAGTKYTVGIAATTVPVTQRLATKDLPSCFDVTKNSVVTLCGGALSGTGPATRSIVLSAPAGAGKSSFLRAVTDELCRAATAAPTALCVVRASCGAVVDNYASAVADEIQVAVSSSSVDSIAYNVSAVLRMLGQPMHIDIIGRAVTSDGLVLVIDNLDTLFDQYSTNRENIPSGSAADPVRVLGHQLSCLLSALRDGMCQARVMVIGATRRGATELLRAHTGCPEFEHCVALPSPATQERAVMIQHLLEEINLPLQLINDAYNEDDTLEQWARDLAGLTAGYLPGDLGAVVQRISLLHAGMSATSGTDHTHTAEEPDTQGQRAVPWRLALDAVAAVVPKQLQDLGLQGNGGTITGSERLSWSDFGGFEEIKADLQRRLRPLLLDQRGTAAGGDGRKGTLQAKPTRGIVIHGPTGCGKTFLASVISSEMKMNFVSVKSTELLSKYFGETENTIRSLFRKARAAAPCVLFFDDFDTLAHKRSAADSDDASTSNGLHGRILSTFLNELDGIVGTSKAGEGGAADGSEAQQVLVIAACRDLTALDEALIRPGRLQLHVHLHEPSLHDVAAILDCHLRSLNCAPDLSLAQAAATLSTIHASAAEVEHFVSLVYKAALREAIAAIERPSGSSDKHESGEGNDSVGKCIEQRHVDAVTEDVLNQHMNSLNLND